VRQSRRCAHGFGGKRAEREKHVKREKKCDVGGGGSRGRRLRRSLVASQ
jgi:hypothetical protein